MSLANDMDKWWWGGDEDEYLDPEGKPISKEDYEKQFEGQVKMPVEPDQPEDLPEQPQFVGDPTQFKPMPFDPNNPMMYMGSGSPFYHLRGGEQGDDELARKMAEFLAPHISSGIGQVADGIQDFFKSPEQREQEKRDKWELEEAERKKKEREEGSWSSLLSPFFHLSGGAIDKYIAMAKEFAKRAGYKDWNSLRRADDGEHKLELRGVKFGRKGYGDFIKYSLDEGVDEAQKHRSAYLSRATKIRGDWAKDMYSPNSLAINILWGGGLSGGGKTEAELEAMSVVKLIDYGKSLGVKGLDGKTKKVIMDKIISHEKTMPEATSVAPKAEDVTSLQLYKMLLMSESLEKDLIPLAKKQGIERILHKNKKTLVNEIYDNLLSNEEIQASDSLENVPKMVRYILGKGPNPYPDSESEEEEGSDEEEDPEEIEVTQIEYDTNPYLIEKGREGLKFVDRRVFDPVTDEELGTLGDDWAKPLADIIERQELVSSAFETAYKALAEKYKDIDGLKEYAKAVELPFAGKSRNDLLNDIANFYAQMVEKALDSGNPDVEGEVQKALEGKGKTVLPPQDVLEGKKDNPVVEETIEEPMDDGDIRQYLPNAKIMRYSALAKLSDIEQLLPKDKSYVFLLYEQTPGSGHWVALMRYGNTIEFFCSYGSKIDAPLRWNNPRDNAMLGQSKSYLSMLLNKAKGKFRSIYNPVAYQSSKQGVATCGAWDVMRINQLINHNQDLHEFHDYMESVKKETGLTYDEIVVNYVSKR